MDNVLCTRHITGNYTVTVPDGSFTLGEKTKSKQNNKYIIN